MAQHRVLLIGYGGFFHVGAFFRRALEELGITHHFIDEEPFAAPKSRSIPGRVFHRLLGRRIGSLQLNQTILADAKFFQPTVVLTTMGRDIDPEVIRALRVEHRAITVNFMTDDPFNPSASSPNVVASIPEFDLYVSTKRAVIPDLEQAGARRVIFVPFGYSPVIHFPESPASPDEAARWRSDVVFLGGGDADRVPFLLPLAREPGLDLKLYGGYWDRTPELAPYWGGWANGRDYRLALGGTKITPGLVRRANRDGHVMRTFEAPACGAFLLAERTAEHLEMFDEGTEMAFFDSPEDLLDKTRYYLTHDTDRHRLTAAAHRKVTTGGHTYRDRLVEILRAVE